MRGAIALLLYVLGALVLPGWHFLAHHLDHDHAGNGLHYSVHALHAQAHAESARAEPHAEAHHLENKDADPNPTSTPPCWEIGRCPAFASPPSRLVAPDSGHTEDPLHGLGSIAHFGCAYLPALQLGLLLAEALPSERCPLPATSQTLRAYTSGCPLGARAPPCDALART